MRKKPIAETASVAPPPAVVPVAPQTVAPQTEDFNGRETHTVYIESEGELTAVKHHHPRHQRIRVAGVAYYHVREHNGAWVYRNG